MVLSYAAWLPYGFYNFMALLPLQVITYFTWWDNITPKDSIISSIFFVYWHPWSVQVRDLDGDTNGARVGCGIQQFPAATQNKLFELLGKLKQENVDSLTILVLGKGGMGKSSTVNSVIGERAVAVSAFQSEGPRPVMVSRSRAGFTLNIIDTPGLVEGGYVNDRALYIIKSFLLNRTIDILLYVDRLDAYRVDTLDRQIIKAITYGFGKAIWNRAAVVLSHAQLSPPDIKLRRLCC